MTSYSGARSLDALKTFVKEEVAKRNAPATEEEETVEEEEAKVRQTSHHR